MTVRRKTLTSMMELIKASHTKDVKRRSSRCGFTFTGDDGGDTGSVNEINGGGDVDGGVDSTDEIA